MSDYTAESTSRVSGLSASRSMSMRCIDAAGRQHELACRFDYDAADPFAVSLSFPAHPTVRPWVFGRDLLVMGLDGPAGEGDVHVWPSIGAEGYSVVIVELRSPHGELIGEVRAADVRSLIEESFALVPNGSESTRVDMDAVIADLLGSVA